MTDRAPVVIPTLRPTLRVASPDDAGLLRDLFAETREAELAALPDDGVRELFLAMQWAAQKSQYERAHPDAESHVIRAVTPDGGELAVGRLLVSWLPDRVHIIDISVLTAHRGNGHGSAALTELLRRADAADVPVTLSLLRQNRAAHRLYSRWGFSDSAGSAEDSHLIMRRARRSDRSAAV